MLGMTVQELAHALPFKPFVIQMSDGRRFAIRHPDFISVSPQGSFVIVFGPDDSGTHLPGLLIASAKLLGRRRLTRTRPRRERRR
jgi:hypothetical protein